MVDFLSSANFKLGASKDVGSLIGRYLAGHLSEHVQGQPRWFFYLGKNDDQSRQSVVLLVLLSL